MFSFKQTRQKDPDDNCLVSLPIDSVLPNPDQPRRTFDEASLRSFHARSASTG
jgi:hypothetical protein